MDRLMLHCLSRDYEARLVRSEAMIHRAAIDLMSCRLMTACGYLLTGLTPGEWRVVDAFENPLYDLERIELLDRGHGWA
ncbi:hypothetical protein [Actinomadura sp. 9N407]|uniref:hypothetical protein n=1 Tax=Actinomadura sp. 9N407 TaxID=3375154 RepID=UPI0037B19E0D